MRAFLVLSILAFALSACKSTDIDDSSKKDIIITRGMPISEVVSMIGEPKFIKSGVDIGGVKMDSWHYEIIVSRVSGYQEIDTYIEPSDQNFRVLAPKDFVDDAAIQTMLVQTTKTQFMDILVYENRVFSVHGEVRVTLEKQDWRD